MKCCICEKEIPMVGTWDQGNSADPVVENGRCCNDCDNQVVIPARIARVKAYRASMPKGRHNE